MQGLVDMREHYRVVLVGRLRRLRAKRSLLSQYCRLAGGWRVSAVRIRVVEHLLNVIDIVIAILDIVKTNGTV